MKKKGLQKMEIEPLSEFKKRNPELCDALLKGDSIMFDIYNKNRRPAPSGYTIYTIAY